MRKITIIHPSRQRPVQALATQHAWLSNAANPDNIEYILSIDTSDPSPYKRLKGVNVLKSDNKSAIEAINNAATHATGDILISISDDFTCLPNWDALLLKEIGDRQDILVKTPDGYQKELITLPIMDRKYYERFGYIYYPGYAHLFADTEMTEVGKLLGKTVYIDLLFEHLHYSLGKSKKDSINAKNDKTWNQGKRLFNERKANDFDL